MKRFSQIILFSLLAALPVVDFLYRWEGSSPAVMIRAGITVLMFLMLLPNFFAHKTTKVHPIVKYIMLLMAYMAVTTVIADGGFQSAYSYIRVCYALIGFLLVYYLTKNTVLDDRFFLVFFLAVIVIHGALSYMNIGYRLESRRGLAVADNMGYTLLTLFSAVMLFTKKKYVFFTTIFIIATGVLISGKRGAMLALIISAIPLIKYIFTFYTRSGFKKVVIVMLAIVACVLALYMFGDYFNASLGRFNELEEDGGSGRNNIYLLYLYNFWNSDLLQLIFGHGLHGGLWGNGHKHAFIHLLAHNDWLQLLFDFGVVGAFLYLLMFISMFRTIRQHRQSKDVFYYMLIIAFITWSIKSMLSSTFFMTPNSIYMYMAAAYSIGKLELNCNRPNS